MVQPVDLLRDHTHELLTLSLTLYCGDWELEFIYPSSRRQEVSQLQFEIEKLMG